jgi:predicted nicotinamide N-methyase
MTSVDPDAPLSLSELKRWMSEEVASWIQEGDEKQAQLEQEMEENAAYNVSNLFGSKLDEDITIRPANRVQQWCSSSIHIDGIGGFEPGNSTTPDSKEKEDEPAVQLVFILSESYEGFGDTLWSSARYIANVLANPSQCQEILSPLLSRRGRRKDPTANDSNSNPLVGMSFLEVGAGAGVPSWSAMHCGARVVCTDLSSTNRIRSMGECAERNYRMMEAAGNPLYADQTKVCPHDWGSPTENVLKALNKSGEERFDVIVAADCCYMPWLYAELLDSIDGLLSDIGICIICFALHDNTDDDDVWKIVDRAKEKGFVVEVLPSTQLTPPTSHMEAKQGLVHSVRLSRPHA